MKRDIKYRMKIKKNNILDVVYATDRNYLPICSVSMISLLDKNTEFERINIHILTLDLEKKHTIHFKKIEKKFKNAKFYFYRMDDIIKKYTIKSKGFPIGSYLRIFMGSILSGNIEKVLYLDGDTLIFDNIRELWNIELEENVCGGILDPVTIDAKTRIGLKGNDNYFNAGVILINLYKWRKDDIEQKMINFLNERSGNVFHHDQGLFNAVIRDWEIIHPRFDMMSPYSFFNRRNLIKIYQNLQIPAEKEITEAKKNPVIYHDKFWAKYWIHPVKKLWWEYNSQSPFGKPIDRIRRTQKINNWLQHFLPMPIYWRIWRWQWKRRIERKGQI